MDELNVSNKDVLARMAELLGIHSDNGKRKTVESKLSKLRGGDVEGVRHFFDAEFPDRLQALAAALELKPAELVSLRERLCERPTLVLDPRLAPSIREQLQLLAEDANAPFHVSSVPEGPDVLPALAEASTAVDHAILVLARAEDMKIFEVVKRACTLVELVPRGLRLTLYPDLISVRPPRAPRLWDDSGAPLVPIESAWRPPRHGSRLVRDADALGEVPCLPLKDAIEWFSHDEQPLYDRDVRWVSEPKAELKHVTGVVPPSPYSFSRERIETLVWSEGNNIFAVGPSFEHVRKALGPHHQVQEPIFKLKWCEITEAANPWRLREEALDPVHPLHPARTAIEEWAKERQSSLEKELYVPPQSPGVLKFDDSADHTRQLVHDLSRREFEVDTAEVAFLMDRALRAPWVVFSATATRSELRADMGAGIVVHLNIRRTASTPAPCRSVGKYGNGGHAVYDWGDCLVAVTTMNDSRLEGPGLPAREHRRERRRQETDDNDDD